MRAGVSVGARFTYLYACLLELCWYVIELHSRFWCSFGCKQADALLLRLGLAFPPAGTNLAGAQVAGLPLETTSALPLKESTHFMATMDNTKPVDYVLASCQG